MSNRWPVTQWYGRDEPPTERVQLRAGELSAVFQAPDLRWVQSGRHEVAQRVYMAVRDNAWNTIPGDISDVHVSAGEQSFEIGFTSRHRYREIDFEWRATIEGTADGRISYEMDGQARAHFQYAKIGLLVHHPLPASAGQPYRAHTPLGEISGRLPLEIVPQRIANGRLTALFPEYDRLSIGLPGGGWADFEFEGDLWEMQDHRNWADGNFKSYGTPMSVPFPFDAEPGQRLWQRITVSTSGARPLPAAGSTEVTLTIGEQPIGDLPPIGFQIATHGEGLTEREARLLRQARPDHLRIDLQPEEEGFEEPLAACLEQAARLGSGIELALHLGPDGLAGLERLLLAVRPLAGVVRRVLVFQSGGYSAAAGATPSAIVQQVRESTREILAGVPIAGGSHLFFSELNRDRPDPAAMDALVYGVNPQVHACDDASLVENLEAQAATVQMAHRLADGRPVFVSPVTFIGANGPYPAGPPTATGLPGNVDVRQASLFGAAWTVGSVKHLAESGASALTFFETTGWLGLLERESGSPKPELFPSSPGMAFPLYHVFADIGNWKRGRLVPVQSTDGLKAEALAVAHGGGLSMLIANLQHQWQTIVVSGLSAQVAEIRRLDDETFQQATMEPEDFRAQARTRLPIDRDGLHLELGPLATLMLELSSS